MSCCDEFSEKIIEQTKLFKPVANFVFSVKDDFKRFSRNEITSKKEILCSTLPIAPNPIIIILQAIYLIPLNL